MACQRMRGDGRATMVTSAVAALVLIFAVVSPVVASPMATGGTAAATATTAAAAATGSAARSASRAATAASRAAAAPRRARG